jgi:hypothetical protein
MTPELLFALLFAGILAHGFWEGRMPMRWFDLDRTRNPLGFWLGAGLLALIAASFLWLALDPNRP